MMIPPVHTVHTLVFIQSANVVQDAITSTPPPSRAHLVLCCSAPAPIIMGHLKHERLRIYISPLQITNIYHPLQSQQLIVNNCYTVLLCGLINYSSGVQMSPFCSLPSSSNLLQADIIGSMAPCTRPAALSS